MTSPLGPRTGTKERAPFPRRSDDPLDQGFGNHQFQSRVQRSLQGGDSPSSYIPNPVSFSRRRESRDLPGIDVPFPMSFDCWSLPQSPSSTVYLPETRTRPLGANTSEPIPYPVNSPTRTYTHTHVRTHIHTFTHTCEHVHPCTRGQRFRHRVDVTMLIDENCEEQG